MRHDQKRIAQFIDLNHISPELVLLISNEEYDTMMEPILGTF